MLPVVFGLSVCLVISFANSSLAEAPDPGVHWGALGYPDQERTLQAGLMLNRFTEFNSHRDRFNSTIRETIGLNFGSLSWTERLREWGVI